ncbi:MAG: 50S ribosomal protein L6 [bacterium]|nr:50S ribosomal protein L6 [bacterium]
MSKIGKIPVLIPEGVKITEKEGKVTVTGSKGTMSFTLPKEIDVKIDNERLIVVPKNNLSSALFGLSRAIIANLVKGVTVGFEKKLELSGVGYRAQVSGNDLMLFLGFSHPVKIPAVEGITFQVLENVITVSGINKNLVGDIAAKIKGLRPPDPYKGKGISYLGEKIRRKVGKAAKAVGAK